MAPTADPNGVRGVGGRATDPVPRLAAVAVFTDGSGGGGVLLLLLDDADREQAGRPSHRRARLCHMAAGSPRRAASPRGRTNER
eukprot:scaffold14295_cov116-Isochrysis_galbana.AAC.5